MTVTPGREDANTSVERGDAMAAPEELSRLIDELSNRSTWNIGDAYGTDPVNALAEALEDPVAFDTFSTSRSEEIAAWLASSDETDQVRAVEVAMYTTAAIGQAANISPSILKRLAAWIARLQVALNKLKGRLNIAGVSISVTVGVLAIGVNW
jgi:hypothetical protein